MAHRTSVCERLVAPSWTSVWCHGQTLSGRSHLHQPHAFRSPEVRARSTKYYIILGKKFTLHVFSISYPTLRQLSKKRPDIPIYVGNTSRPVFWWDWIQEQTTAYTIKNKGSFLALMVPWRILTSVEYFHSTKTSL